jgi:cytochrome c oxidase cbb3-type subunit 3
MRSPHRLAVAAPILALLLTSSHGEKEARRSAGGSVIPSANADPLAQQAAPPAMRHDRHIPVAGNPPPTGTLINPFRGDATSGGQGEKIFALFNCDGCHAGGAVGAVGPSLADGRWKYGGSEGEIFLSIFYGRPNGMPAYGGTLPRDGIWKLVTYLQSLQPREDNPTTSW